MITQKLPTEQKVREEGILLGYSLGIGEQYCEVYRYKEKNWVLLDYYNPQTNEVTYRVAKYHSRIGKLVSGFHEIWGHPC